MAFTFKELKQAKENIMKAYGLDGPHASKVVGYYNGVGGDPAQVQKLIDGDLSGVPAALSALGFAQNDSRKESASVGDRVGAPNGPQVSGGSSVDDAPQIVGDDLRKVLGGPQIIGNSSGGVSDNGVGDISGSVSHGDGMEDMADISGGLLPAGLYDDIMDIIDIYCKSHDIQDKRKVHPLEWQAVCVHVGQSVKARKLLHDFPREKTHGGTVYDGMKVCALLELYGVICAECKQVAFSHNFPRFAGVSREYFNDYLKRDLTSSRVGLAQKAHEIQKASLVGAVTAGGSATVGNIFLSKALAGLQETVTVQHVSVAAAPSASALPFFESDPQGLPDSGGQNGV